MSYFDDREDDWLRGLPGGRARPVAPRKKAPAPLCPRAALCVLLEAVANVQVSGPRAGALALAIQDARRALNATPEREVG